MSPKVDEAYKEQRRLEILEAAKRVFKAKGFETATMKDVVEAAGMSRGFVYSYFGSTEDMFRAVMEQFDAELPDVEALFASAPRAWDVIEQLLSPQMLPQDDMLFVIYEYFTGGWRHPERRVYLEERYDKTHRFYKRILERGVAIGEWNPVVPLDDIVQTLISFTEGLVMSVVQLHGERIRAEAQLHVMKLGLKALLLPK
jgi:AcrR family transcriptional regulator